MLKIYENGQTFVDENKHIFAKYPLEECFLKANAKTLNSFSNDVYALKVSNDEKELIAIKNHPNLLIIGDVEMVEELVYHMVTIGLKFNGLLVNKDIADRFIQCYQKYFDASFNIVNSMNIMTCNKVNKTDDSTIEKASINDAKQIYDIALKFAKEANVMSIDESYFEKIQNKIDSYYVIKDKNKIVSIASIDRETDYLKFVSFVYTDKQYRNKGLSYKLVSYLTNKIISSNKVATLYVDINNLISNHLYKKIGYTYNLEIIQYDVKEKNIKECVFAGGCFWCMAKPYYEYEGVKKVLSGYCGGDEKFPTYEQVKNQKTSHRETVKIIYDSTIISFEKLLDIYFDSIDPFDEEGQFIDKGFSYTTAIFYNDEIEKEKTKNKIREIEEKYNKKVSVKIIKMHPFYLAEEVHQDYSLKNPIEMEQELILSGRKKA